MPVVGTRKSATVTSSRGYKNPMDKYAASFIDLAKDMLRESGCDIYRDPFGTLQISASNNTLKNFFVENCSDAHEEFAALEGATAANEVAEDERLMAEALYDNDRDAVLSEYANVASYNPVIGMTFPIHKNIMMNTIFDKGAIPKVVAKEPKFTISMETRILRTVDGQELDMWLDQNKMREAIDASVPVVEVEVELPSIEEVDLLSAIGADPNNDHLSVDTRISAVKTTVNLLAGDINPETGVAVTEDGEVECWIPVNANFTAGYGEYDRNLSQKIKWKSRNDDGEWETVEEALMGWMQNDKVAIQAARGNVSFVKVAARVDTSSAMFDTTQVSWKVRTDLVEIPSAPHITVPVSPEEIKDIGALYNVNQLSKILSLMKVTLGNYKDDKIKLSLDESFNTMDPRAKNATTFDFAPRVGYALDHVEWRQKTFMDFLDSQVTALLQYLNDANMIVTVFGAPDLIRKITPTEYTYQTPPSIGPVDLEFTKTVVTSDKRVYQFLSSDKLRGNSNLIIILTPRNSERIVYRIYDYQLYVGNDIRSTKNYALPAITAFERFKFVSYQPVQGRCKILHPSGLVDIKPNDDPIGRSEMSDFNMVFANE